jgi:hypothetical protein
MREALKCSGTLQAKLSAPDQHAIEIGSRSYAGKCFEYPEFLGTTTLPIGQWIGIARRLIRHGDEQITPKA